ncbi:MAG TPA: zinc ribbon domain-containing protein [Thermoanaerobaculia bacterium]|nr:zinc ribbon domain-containing protein [Thermoanaerobaculia bacterium]HUM30541.1 zinc ribbon domain-containing protein [Thermoanaerobaculia bacterium]HXK68733.1 zinc ribbon domain-containing protein [Thermoanaerobaculia bacterium]
MPLYEFRCTACQAEIEVLLSISDPYPDTCERCGGTLVKKINAPAIQFKGSGWYITDYARKSSTPAGKSSSESTEAKSDPKSADPPKSTSDS